MKILKKILLGLVVIFMVCESSLFTSCGKKEENLSAQILAVKGGRKGTVTIIHDDGDLPTAEFLLKEMEKNDLKATFAMIGNRIMDTNGAPKQNTKRWVDIYNSGFFDIAQHSYTHSFYGFTDDGEKGTYEMNDGRVIAYDFEPGHMTYEIVGSSKQMEKIFGQKILCYVFPGFSTKPLYNGRNDIAMKIIGDNFIAGRMTGGVGVFGEDRVECLNNFERLNFSGLSSMMVHATDDYRTRWFDYVDNAINYGGWAIYCFHNIWEKEVPSGHNVAQYKAAELFKYIAEKVEKEDLWCATLTEGSLYAREYEKAKVRMNAEDGVINVGLIDKLDNEIFNMPLTVKVEVYSYWDKVNVEIDGKTKIYDVKKDEKGQNYILVDIVPDSGGAKITNAE